MSRKLLAKITALQTSASSCIMLNASQSTTHNETKVIEKNDLFTDLEIGIKDANSGYLNKIKSDRAFFKALAKFIKNTALNFDRIIFRYPFASFGLKEFTKAFDKKIVFEHNTKEIEELKMNIGNKNYAFFSLRPSKFLFWLQEKKYPVYCEQFTAKKIFDHAHSGACVTSEIAGYEKKRNTAYTTFVSSNFYDVASVDISQSIYTHGDMIVLGMIVTTTATWYGLDRLLQSFAKVQNNYKLILAGINEQDPLLNELIQKNKIHQNLVCLGKINKEQLSSFYNSVHACFGSLGLYTLNLNDASTLKVKESVSYGVPVIVAYNEEDFMQNDGFKPYYLQLKNDNSLINFEDIKEFVINFYKDTQNKIKLRDLALKHIDVKVKIDSLLKKIAA